MSDVAVKREQRSLAFVPTLAERLYLAYSTKKLIAGFFFRKPSYPGFEHHIQGIAD
jgi:hypothetical protein